MKMTILSMPILKSLTINKISKILIFGVGYLGQPLFFSLSENYGSVIGICRNKGKHKDFDSVDQNEAGYADIIEQHRAEIIIICWAPNERSDTAYRETYLSSMELLCRALAKFPPKQVIYTSSTGVYSSAPNRIADENDPYLSDSTKHKVLLEAEKMLGSTAKELNFKACVLRLSGLYGPERIPCIRSLKKGTLLPGSANSWIHLIHRDDVISCILACVESKASGLFNVSDAQAYTRDFLYHYFAEKFSYELPKWKLPSSTVTSGKKLLTSRIKSSTGWEPSYPHISDWLKTVDPKQFD